MKEYLDKKIDQLLNNEEHNYSENEVKEIIGNVYIGLRLICAKQDLFLDECIALAYQKMEQQE